MGYASSLQAEPMRTLRNQIAGPYFSSSGLRPLSLRLSVLIYLLDFCAALVCKVAHETRRPFGRSLSRFSVAGSNWEYCYSPLDGMLVHRRVTPSSMSPVPILFYILFLFTWLKRDKVGQSFLSKKTTRWQGLGLETPTFSSEVQRANHYTTAPPQ